MSDSWSVCYERPQELEGNPDIGGIGVLIGFMGTAWIVILFVVIHFVLVVDPRQNPFEENRGNEETSSRPPWEPNYADEAAVKACSWLRRQYFYRNGVVLALSSRKVTLALADIQLLTGLASLLSGYISLLNDSVSAYHWQLLVYLVWFSNLTHISCLTILRGYLYRRRGQGRARLVLMTLLWIGLLVAIGPTIWFDWNLYVIPAGVEPDLRGLEATSPRCFYDPRVAAETSKWRLCEKRVIRKSYATANDCMDDAGWRSSWVIDGEVEATGSGSFPSALISILLTSFTYFTRLAKIIRPISIRLRFSIRRRPSRWLLRRMIKTYKKPQSTCRWVRLWRKGYFRVQVSFYLISSLYFDIISSDLSDTFWLFISGIWGTIRLIQARSSINIDENTWDFGQILPVFLLFGPIFAIMGSIVSARDTVMSRRESLGAQSAGSLHRRTVDRAFIQQELRRGQETQQTQESGEHSTAANTNREASTTPRFSDTLELRIWAQNPPGASLQTWADNRRHGLHLPLDLPFAGGVHLSRQFQLEADGLRDLLHSHCKRTRWMRQMMVLMSLQTVLPAAAFFTLTSYPEYPVVWILTDPWWYLTLLSQPVTCIYGVMFCVCTSQRHILRREFLWFPGIWWLLFASSVIPYYAFFSRLGGFHSLLLQYYVPWQIAALVPISCLWLLCSCWNKWRGT